MNLVYEDKLYNEDRKLEFIEDNDYKEGTQKIVLRIFKVSQVMESELEKDLGEFKRDELRSLFFLFMPKTEASSASNVTWVAKYIEWCIRKGYAQGVSPLSNISTEWKKQFVNKELKRFWTKDEIDQVVSKVVNKRDAAMVDLMFQGVMGQGGTELLNLQFESIDRFNNCLHLHDDSGPRRTITVPEKTIDLCLAAYEVEVYHKSNGKPDPDIKSPTLGFVENNYIIRTVKSRANHFEEAGVNIVYATLARIAKLINEPTFTPTNIVNSGMLYYLKELYIIENKLVDEHYDMVLVRFNKKVENQLYRLKQDFLNEETIKSVYNLP